jgi:hypothetical protein
VKDPPLITMETPGNWALRFDDLPGNMLVPLVRFQIFFTHSIPMAGYILIKSHYIQVDFIK